MVFKILTVDFRTTQIIDLITKKGYRFYIWLIAEVLLGGTNLEKLINQDLNRLLNQSINFNLSKIVHVREVIYTNDRVP